MSLVYFFFFQAEDGIRVYKVTGVQTCALPICSSRFYLCLEDDLMRIFAGEWVKNLLTRLGMKEGEAIESRMVSRRIEGAQKKVEERNFEVRKNLLEYDEVMDEQRKRVYGYRQRILEGANCKELILDMIQEQLDKYLDEILAPNY